jgi:hypothetical protein
MMKLETRIATLVLAGIAWVGCGPGSARDREPGATNSTSGSEIPGAHSPEDLDPITAQRFIDHVRLGREVDSEGKVPEDGVASRFSAAEPIHVSMEVTDAPAGSVVRLSVRDASTDRTLWSEDGKVEGGRSYLTFTVDDELAPGTYRVDVIIGDEVVARKEFQVVVG